MVANSQFMYIYERTPDPDLIDQYDLSASDWDANCSWLYSGSFSETKAYDLDQPTMEEVNYMGESYGNTYNPSWRNHPSLSWKDQQKPQQGFNNNQGGRNQNRFNNRPPFPSSQGNMETSKQSFSDLVTLVSSLSKTIHSFINETRSSIRNIEVQLVKNSGVERASQGALARHSTPKQASILALNASEEPITGRSTPNQPKKLALNASKDTSAGHSTPKTLEELAFNAKLKEAHAHVKTIEVPLNALLRCINSDEYSSSNEDEDTREEKVARYLGSLMRLNAKLLGTKLLEEEPPLLAKELHALVQQRPPQKLPDPGRFLIPCTIGTMTIEKALYDLRSRINLMPLSVMEKLGIREVQTANISLEMADKTIKKPYGLVEDVLVKVENHYIPTNFIVLDIGEDEDNSVILEKSFLATANAIIDVAKGELTLQLGEDYILFKMPHPNSPSNKREMTVQHLVF
ncbi:hypothetical protein AHAS_Ahas10G0087400 [Arachis hypogaea]